MESLIHKTLEDYRYAKRMENNKFKVFQPKQEEYDADILDNMNTGSLSKAQFGHFIDFIRTVNLAGDSVCDLGYMSSDIPLQDVKRDLMLARLTYDNLPVIYDKDGKEIPKPNRDLLTIKVGTKEEVDAYYRNKLDGQFDEKGNPLDKERYVFAGLASNSEAFFENVLCGDFKDYLAEVDKAVGTSFAEEVPTQFEIYPHGIHTNGCFNENGNLIIHSYRMYEMMHTNEHGKEYDPQEYDLETIPLEEDLVSDKNFDVELDFYAIGQKVFEEREALANPKVETDEKEVEQAVTAPILEAVEVRMPVEKKEEPKVKEEPVIKVVKPASSILQSPVSSANSVFINGKLVEASDKQAESLKKGDMLEHKAFGMGEFQSFNEKGYMVILFESDSEPKIVVPRAFSMGLIKKAEKKKATEKKETNEISKAEALIENKTKPLLYDSTVKENMEEKHTAILDAVQEHITIMDFATHSEVVTPKPVVSEEKAERNDMIASVVESANTEPVIEGFADVDPVVVSEMNSAKKKVRKKRFSLEERNLFEFDNLFAMEDSVTTASKPIEQETPLNAESANEKVVEEDTVKRDSAQTESTKAESVSVESVKEESALADNVKVEIPAVKQETVSTVKEDVPVVKQEVVSEKTSQQEAETIALQQDVKKNRISIRVFADRVVENKSNNRNNGEDKKAWVNFRMAYGKFKDYTFGVPPYFVYDGLPVGKERNVKTKVISFYPDWKRIVFTHPTEKDLRVSVPFKDALKLIEDDMCPKVSTTSLVPKRPLMYNRNKGNTLE